MIETENVCRKCILPDGFLGVEINSEGVCGFCSDPDHKNINWSRTEISNERRKSAIEDWNTVVEQMWQNHGKVKYDCIIGYSGGKDSTALLDHLINDLKLTPLAVTSDTGFMTDIAKDNIKDTLAQINVDHALIEECIPTFTKIYKHHFLNPPVSPMIKDNIEKKFDSRDYKLPIETEIPSVRDFSEFKSWMLKTLSKIEEFVGIPPIIEQTKDSLKKPANSEQTKTNSRLVVDLTNILYQDLDKNERLKTRNILSIRDDLLSKGYNPFLIVDASTKHKVDDTDQYEMLENNNIINQAPAKRTADKFVLKCAKNWNCKFLTNDQFIEYWDEFGKEWVLENRVTYMFVEGELILD